MVLTLNYIHFVSKDDIQQAKFFAWKYFHCYFFWYFQFQFVSTLIPRYKILSKRIH